MQDDWIYIGVFLNKESKEKIINHLQNIGIEIPNDWKLFMDHMTLCYNKHDDESEKLYDFYQDFIGSEIELICGSIGITDDIIAIGISYNLPIQNKTPHITIATDNVPPVRSNFIQNWESIPEIKLKGIIKIFRKQLNLNERLYFAIENGIKKALMIK